MDMFAYPLMEPEEHENIDGFIQRFVHDEGMKRLIDNAEQLMAVAYVQWGRKFVTYKNANKPAKNILRSKFVLTRIFEEEPTGFIEVENQEGDSIQVDGAQEGPKIEAQSPPDTQVKGTKMMGYASVSNVQDLEHDIIMPGAWQKTLNERVKSGKVPLMTKHVAEGGMVVDTIGYMNAASREDNIGLFGVFDILDTDLAQQCWRIAKSSIEVMKPIGLSVEFFPVEGKYEPNNFGGFTFHEVKLIQVTLTPTPCNELSGVFAVKNMPKQINDIKRKWIACKAKYSLHTS